MDMDTTTISKNTREFLRISDEEGFVESISSDIPKTYIITEENSKSKIYLTPISSYTLLKRLNSMYTYNKNNSEDLNG